jgi:hypothetical protein
MTTIVDADRDVVLVHDTDLRLSVGRRNGKLAGTAGIGQALVSGGPT